MLKKINAIPKERHTMDFYKRVEYVCKQIPRGRAATYGQIALLCGMPSHSRQVGYALNKKLTSPDIPAHRIVNHKGYLSGSASFTYPATQESLLKEEGIPVTPEHTIDLKKYAWHHTLDDAIRFRAYFTTHNL